MLGEYKVEVREYYCGSEHLVFAARADGDNVSQLCGIVLGAYPSPYNIKILRKVEGADDEWSKCEMPKKAKTNGSTQLGVLMATNG